MSSVSDETSLLSFLTRRGLVNVVITFRISVLTGYIFTNTEIKYVRVRSINRKSEKLCKSHEIEIAIVNYFCFLLTKWGHFVSKRWLRKSKIHQKKLMIICIIFNFSDFSSYECTSLIRATEKVGHGDELRE